MSTEENKAIIRHLYEQENAGNTDIIDTLIDPNFVAYGDGIPQIMHGTQIIKQGVIGVKTAYPDLQVTIEDLVAEGDRVAVHLRWRGTHKGEFMGIPPTGKEMTWTAIAINRISNGKIVERWFNSDNLGMFQQLGVIPPIGQGK